MADDARPLQGQIFDLGASRPKIAASAWVAPGAMVIGDVVVGEGSSVWFNCVIRGDANTITIGRGANIQDGTIVHVDPGLMATSIGDFVTVGHGCIIHGCKLLDRAFVGMGAILLNGATVESDAMLAAGAVLTSGKIVPSGELWAGSPAKLLRKLREDELADIKKNADRYADNGVKFRTGLSISEASR